MMQISNYLTWIVKDCRDLVMITRVNIGLGKKVCCERDKNCLTDKPVYERKRRLAQWVAFDAAHHGQRRAYIIAL